MNVIDDFISQSLNQGYDPDGAYGRQCVDYVDAYAITLFGDWINTLRPVNGAVQLLDRANPDFFQIVFNDPNDPNQIPPRGAIVVWNGWKANPAGHTEIVVSSDNNGMNVQYEDGSTVRYDANGNVIDAGAPARAAYRTYNALPGGLRGWLIPILPADVPAPAPTPTPVPMPDPVVVDPTPIVTPDPVVIPPVVQDPIPVPVTTAPDVPVTPVVDPAPAPTPSPVTIPKKQSLLSYFFFVLFQSLINLFKGSK